MLLICTSLIIQDVKNPFKYLPVMCIAFLEKCIFRSFAHFLNGLFLIVEFASCLYVLDKSLSNDLQLFSTVSWLFTFLMVFSEAQKF